VNRKIEKPIVQTFHRNMPKARPGRGYSKNEIFQAGVVNLRVALKRDIPIDKLRTSSHPENIEKLKKIFNEVKTIIQTQSSAEKRSKAKRPTSDKDTPAKRNSPKKEVSKTSKRTALKKIIKKSE